MTDEEWNKIPPEAHMLMSQANTRLKSLCGYALTCRKNNTEEWMKGLTDRLNLLIEAEGDNDRYEFNGDYIEQVSG